MSGARTICFENCGISYGHLAYNEYPKELSEDVFIKQSQALRELAEDRNYFKNKDCVIQHQGKLLRMLPLT